jgi:hypothetical protein
MVEVLVTYYQPTSPHESICREGLPWGAAPDPAPTPASLANVSLRGSPWLWTLPGSRISLTGPAMRC